MAVKHAKVSAVADGADTALVQPSDWNSSHTIEDNTITTAMVAADAVTYAKMQNISATQRVLGRNTAGAGDTEEVTAAQLLDWVSSTNGVLLTRNASGGWSAAVNVGIDADGDLLMTEETTPTTPAANKVKLYASSIADRSMPTFVNASGNASPLQPFIGSKSICAWRPVANGNTMQTLGINATAQGTPTARAPATTNLFTSTPRIGYVSAAGAGNTGGARFVTPYLWRGNGAGLGGFHASFRFGWSDAALVATGRGFVGLIGSGALPTDVDPSTLTNLIGVGCNNGDANMQLYAAGAAAQARTDLGASFPANTVSTDVYELHLYCAPNSAVIDYQLTRLNTGASTSGTISAAANLPSDTTLLTPTFWRGNGGTASAVAVDIAGYYSEVI